VRKSALKRTVTVRGKIFITVVKEDEVKYIVFTSGKRLYRVSLKSFPDYKLYIAP